MWSQKVMVQVWGSIWFNDTVSNFIMETACNITVFTVKFWQPLLPLFFLCSVVKTYLSTPKCKWPLFQINTVDVHSGQKHSTGFWLMSCLLPGIKTARLSRRCIAVTLRGPVERLSLTWAVLSVMLNPLRSHSARAQLTASSVRSWNALFDH